MQHRLKSLIQPIALIAALLLALNAVATAQELTRKFDEYLSAVEKHGVLSGAVLVARDGKIVFSKAYGLANKEHDVPNSPQTKFRIASNSKQFTAAAILLLQERGKLSVQDPLCKYINDCPALWKAITIHHLLAHESGVANITAFPEFRKLMPNPMTPEELVTLFKSKPLDFPPGEKFSYSNSGYILLAYIIEKASGETYESFLQKNLFAPLRMNNSGYDHAATILKHRAAGYSRRDGQWVNTPYIDMSIPIGGGSLYSTVEDLFLWYEGLFNDKLLTVKSRELMMRPNKDGRAYGLVVGQLFNRQQIHHSGGINGFSSHILRFPAEKLTVVVLRNTDGGEPGPVKVSQALAAIALGEPYDIPQGQPVTKIDPKVYDAYVGRYQLPGSGMIASVAREGDKLFWQGQIRAEMLPKSETVFVMQERPVTFTFKKNDSGKVTELELDQGGGRVVTAKRIE
jgi:CubicO group peptidase (beta-lactamase class C family)